MMSFDISVRAVGPRLSATHVNCALETLLLTDLLDVEVRHKHRGCLSSSVVLAVNVRVC